MLLSDLPLREQVTILKNQLQQARAERTTQQEMIKSLKTEIKALVATIHALEERHSRALALANTEHEVAALRFELKQMTELAAARQQRICELEPQKQPV